MTNPRTSPAPLLRAVSPRFIIPTVTGCLALAAYLVPQKAELVKRLMVDGQHARAMAVATDSGSTPFSVTPSAPAAAPVVKTPVEQLREALHAAQLSQTPNHGHLATVITQVADANVCLDLVRQMDSGLTTEQREKVYLEISKCALAQNNPKFAAAILAEAAEKGVRSLDLLAQEVQAYRWSEQPKKAMDALQAWKKDASLPPNLVDEEISLLREMNQPAKALDLLTERLSEEKQSTGFRKETILQASEVAANAGQMKRILPVIGEFLNNLPAGKASLADLASGKVKADETWLKFASLTAQHCEWGGAASEAFPLYQKLAVLGDRKALDRVLDLNLGLNLDGEVMEVLRGLVPMKDRPELTVKFAHLLADAGEYDLSDRWYGEWLEQNPKDIDAMLERAAVAEEQSRLSDAMEIYRKALALEPKNLKIQKEIADIQIARREFRDAFEFYEQLPEKDHDSVTLENYALIAESLAEYPAYNRALVVRQHRLKQPTTQDFLELARSFEVIGDAEGVIKTYEGGLAKFPRSRIMHIELANTYRLQNRYEEALALLAKPELKSDMHAMQLYIEVACLEEDYAGALAFLGKGFENKFAFGPEVRLDLGHIYFNTGYLAEADALYASVPDEPTLWPLIANARFKVGNFASAEEYQKKYLGSLTTPDPQGWMMMGDIYKATGREAEATAAYAKSLSLMADKLDSDDEDEGSADAEPRIRPAEKVRRPLPVQEPAKSAFVH